MLSLSDATEADCDFIFRLANDPSVRANSFSTDPIPYENHLKWYSKTLKSTETKLLIILWDQQQIGQLRIDINRGKSNEIAGIISFSLVKEWRGRGIGTQILLFLQEHIHEHFPEIEILIGKVKPNNIASEKAFLKANFTKNQNLEEFLEFKIRIK